MKDQIRAEFEQEFPLPNGVTFDGDHYVADPAVIGSFQNATIWSHMYRGWKTCALPDRKMVVDERESFVKASRPFYRPDSMAWDYGQDRFYDDHVQRAWRLWQARAALAPVEIVQADLIERSVFALDLAQSLLQQSTHHGTVLNAYRELRALLGKDGD